MGRPAATATAIWLELGSGVVFGAWIPVGHASSWNHGAMRARADDIISDDIISYLAERAFASPLALKNGGSPSDGGLSREPTQPLPRAVDEGDGVRWRGCGVDLGQCGLRCHHARVQAGAAAAGLIVCHHG